MERALFLGIGGVLFVHVLDELLSLAQRVAWLFG